MTFADYVTAAAKIAGTDAKLGQILGFADGSRIGAAKKGTGARFSELACVRLARYMADDPLEVLSMAGHDEIAQLLQGAVTLPQVEQTRASLLQLQGVISLALQATGGMDNRKQTSGHPTASRQVRGAVDR